MVLQGQVVLQELQERVELQVLVDHQVQLVLAVLQEHQEQQEPLVRQVRVVHQE